MSWIQEHQKVVIALIFGVTIIAISGIYAYRTGDKQTTPHTTKNTTAAQQADTGDADKDGVPDWKEILYGTDPYNADTFGHGLGDKEEIAKMKASKEAQDATGDTTITANTNTTITERAADKLIGSYIVSQQKQPSTDGTQPTTPGTPGKSADEDEIVKQTLQTVKTLSYTHYDPSQIHTISGVTKSSALTYRTAVRDALAPLKQIKEYELQTYARAVDKNDPAEFKKLSDAGAIYASVAQKLMTLTVPKDALEQHADLAESFSYTGAALTAMGKGYDDVIGSYRAVGHFGKAEDRVTLAFDTLKVYFLSKQIDAP